MTTQPLPNASSHDHPSSPESPGSAETACCSPVSVAGAPREFARTGVPASAIPVSSTAMNRTRYPQCNAPTW
jgi:hypothetical protein